ncbi:hypothetical protein ACEWY4_027861 [Coilia grayii]|uniref:Fibronectin type-III domain-containing protein n=1 Tax=Coilia grayii TaxID=363190 RepID=A0ABD1IP06_9TELE
MHLMWALGVLLLPLLVETNRTHTTPHSSLECYNNYVDYPFKQRPLITCSWIQEDPDTHLALSYKNGSPCVTSSTSASQSAVTSSTLANQRAVTSSTRANQRAVTSSTRANQRVVQCEYEASDVSFAIGGKYTFFFHSPQHLTPHTLSASLSQHVRVMSPQKLSVEALKGKGHRLRWMSPYPNSTSLTSDLSYQLTYGISGHDWMTLDTRATAQEIGVGQLLPGQRYEARVRARSSDWQWSAWSPPVVWSTEEELGPYDLQCVMGEDSSVACSWKLLKQHAQFLKYTLTCHHLSNNTTVECCCSPEVQSEGAVELRFSCVLCVSDPRHLRLQLSPTHLSKTFNAETNIQPETPPGFDVKQKNGDWKLRWGDPGVRPNVPLLYEIRYRPQEAEEWKTISLQKATSFTLPSNLLPSTPYVAQIRAVVGPSKTYRGAPSRWSAPLKWTTPTAPLSLASMLYSAVALVVVVLFTGMVIALPKCRRRIRDWKLSIPSPTNSKVVSEAIKRKASDWLYVVSEREKVSMCVIQEADLTSSTHSACKEQRWSSSDEDGDRDSLQLMTYTTGGRSGALDTSGMSFNGPYIFCSKESAQSSTAPADLPLPLGTASDPPSPSPSALSSSSCSSSSSVGGLVSPVSDVSFLSSLSEVGGGYVATLQMPVSVPVSVPVPVPRHPHPSEPRSPTAPPEAVREAHASPPSTAAPWRCQPDNPPTEPPPAYTRQPPALHTVVLPRPAGYCSLPSLDLSGWATPAAVAPSLPPPSPRAPAVPLAQSCTQPPGGEQEPLAPEPTDSSRPYVRLKSGYTTTPAHTFLRDN